MVELLLKRYLWLIDTLKRDGELTFEEISSKWDSSSVNDNGVVLSKRTFYNHCQAIARHFGIDIECRRGRGLNLYRIANPEAIEENSLPIHHSQNELETKDGHTDFSLQLVPTFDFIQELLLHREQLKVISPQSLRDEIASIISKRVFHNDC